jgi:GxxExxY protein
MSHRLAPLFTDNPAPGGVDSVMMDSPLESLKPSELTEKIVRVFYDVYNELGYGFRESNYAEAMVIALDPSGLAAGREVPLPVWCRGTKGGQYFAELLVDHAGLLELKAAGSLESAREAQRLHDRRATEIDLGLLLNFGQRPQFRRLLFDHHRKRIHENRCQPVAQVSA